MQLLHSIHSSKVGRQEYIWLKVRRKITTSFTYCFKPNAQNFSVPGLSAGGKHPISEDKHRVRNAKHLIKEGLGSLKCKKTVAFDYLGRHSREKFMTTENSFQIKYGANIQR